MMFLGSFYYCEYFWWVCRQIRDKESKLIPSRSQAQVFGRAALGRLHLLLARCPYVLLWVRRKGY